MTLAAVDWLSISINLLLIVFVIVALLMSLLILMQRPKQEGLGAAFGSGMTDQMFGARTTNVLQKGTVYLASLFFILTLALAILYAKKGDYTRSLKQSVEPKEEALTTEEAAAADAMNVDLKSLEETLKEVAGDDAEPTVAPEAGEETPAAGEEAAEEAPASDEPAVEEPAGEEPEADVPAGDEPTDPQ